jgi:hypothetical protein
MPDVGGCAKKKARNTAMTQSAWHYFVRKHRHEHDLAALGLQWNAMSAQQKADVQALADAQPVALPEPAPLAAKSAWPHTGDDWYPVDAASMDDVPAAVPRLSQAWKNASVSTWYSHGRRSTL